MRRLSLPLAALLVLPLLGPEVPVVARSPKSEQRSLPFFCYASITPLAMPHKFE
jgi:hypothetical protein